MRAELVNRDVLARSLLLPNPRTESAPSSPGRCRGDQRGFLGEVGLSGCQAVPSGRSRGSEAESGGVGRIVGRLDRRASGLPITGLAGRRRSERGLLYLDD